MVTRTRTGSRLSFHACRYVLGRHTLLGDSCRSTEHQVTGGPASKAVCEMLALHRDQACQRQEC